MRAAGMPEGENIQGNINDGIKAGKDAGIVLFDEDIHVAMTMIKGRTIYRQASLLFVICFLVLCIPPNFGFSSFEI